MISMQDFNDKLERYYEAERQMFTLFQVPLISLLQNKFEFFWQKGLPFSELDIMPYWKFEEYIKMFNKRSKDEAEAQKKQQQQQNQNSPKMPNMPNMNSFKPPSMPSFKR